MVAVHKKQESKTKEEKPVETKPKETKKEPVILSDVVTETTERIEVIEEVDQLSDFKEKMIEEESSVLDESSKKNYMWPILFIFIIAVLLLAGVFLYKNGGIIKNEKVNVVTFSPSPTVIPQPTKTIDLAKYEIEIQNGGGVSGEAGRQKASLETEGFTVSSIGNADNSDYTDTIIKAKAEVDKDFIAKLKSFLNESFTVGEIGNLSDDSSVPVVVIIGTKK